MGVALAGMIGVPSAGADATSSIYWSSRTEGTIGAVHSDGTGRNDALVDFHTVRPDDVVSDGVHLFWIDQTGQAIGRSNVDGTGVEPRFIRIATGTDSTALTVSGGYLYWADPSGEAIARATIDGTTVANSFVSLNVSPQPFVYESPTAIAVSANYLYWLVSDGTMQVGRSDLDGTHIVPSLVTGAYAAHGLATDASHLYWSRTGGGVDGIGRSNLDGTAVQPAFITDSDGIEGVTAQAGKLFWLNRGWRTASPASIGQANADGTGVNQAFASIGGAATGSLASDAAHLYWTDSKTGIGRGTLAGTDLTPGLIGQVNAPDRLAAVSDSLFWLARGTGQVGAVDVSGASAPSLLPGVSGAFEFAASPQGIYWVGSESHGFPVIGRADLGGSIQSAELVSLGGAESPSVAASSQYVFWAPADADNQRIGRASADGTNANAAFITLPVDELRGEIAADDQYVYWTASGSRIGRAKVDGTDVEPNFITGVDAFRLASDGEHLYWTEPSAGRIGRANFDGTQVTPGFLAGVTSPDGGIAVALPVSPINLVAPSITGTADFGSSLTCDPGTWSGTPTSYTYVWLRNDAPVDGATAQTYSVAASDQGASLACRVTATNPTGSTVATSPARSVPAAPPTPTPTPTPEPTPVPMPTPTPVPTPTPQATGSGSGGSGVAKPTARISSSKVKAGKGFVLATTGLSDGTKLTVTWKPKHGKVTQQSVAVSKGQVRLTAPKKKGTYTLQIKQGATILLTTKVAVK